MYRLFLLITISLLFLQCSDNGKNININKVESNQVPEKTINKDLTKTKVIEDEDGPPFKNNCPCSFDELGALTVNNRYEVFVSGKGWNPNLNSCDWLWGELVNNEVPKDSLVTEVRVHLLNLDKLNSKIDADFLKSKIFKENLIASYISKWGENTEIIDTTIYDPYKTGKYKSPK